MAEDSDRSRLPSGRLIKPDLMVQASIKRPLSEQGRTTYETFEAAERTQLSSNQLVFNFVLMSVCFSINHAPVSAMVPYTSYAPLDTPSYPPIHPYTLPYLVDN